MKTVFVLLDSLNRHVLGCYGGRRMPTLNFDRLAARARVFDKHYVGSLPCMPARRDLLTGRLTFLHRSWGPLEPFDNAFPELLKESGVHSHLVVSRRWWKFRFGVLRVGEASPRQAARSRVSGSRG